MIHYPSMRRDESVDVEALAAARWYAGKADGPIEDVAVLDALRVPHGALALARVRTAAGAAAYTLTLGPPDRLWPELRAALAAGEEIRGANGGVFVPSIEGTLGAGSWRELDPDQSNTSIVFDDQVVLKLYRRPFWGVHPEAEALAALELDEVPAYRGSLLYRAATGAEMTLALVQDFVPGASGGWDFWIERLVSLDDDGGVEAAGRAAGRLHRALAAAFGAEHAQAEQLEARVERAVERLETVARALGHVDVLGEAEPRLLADLVLYRDCGGAELQRLHGDLTVAQLLNRHELLSIIDFEGAPDLTAEERRSPWSPAWDCATLLLSFENAAAAADKRVRERRLDPAPLERFRAELPGRLLEAYKAGGGRVLEEPFLRASLADKQIAELHYAAAQLPEWLYAPLDVLGRRWT